MLIGNGVNPDLEVVQKDADALYIGNVNTVEFNLELSQKGIHGSDIIWKSDNERVISDTGNVNRPKYGMGNRTVNLSACIRYKTAELRKVFQVRVLEEENRIGVKRIFPMHFTAYKGDMFCLPAAAAIETNEGRIIPHLIDWKDEIEFRFDKACEIKKYGILEGTTIPVEAIISVIDEKVPVLQEGIPAVKPCNDARLRGDSIFLNAQNRFERYLSEVDDDRMLFNFRQASGLDTKKAVKMTGWDSPESLLRGHTTGHYLSGLALCYRATKNPKIRKKAEYMLQALKECQDAFAKQEGVHSGFLSGYSEEQFELLEGYVLYPKVWAPYYTLHKILAGILDCYEFADIKIGRTIAEKLGDWVYNRLRRLSGKQLMKMWSLYIAGETGGMNEVMVRLYRITNKKEYLKTAKLFDNDKLFYPLSEKIDALDTMHANQHIPQIIGAIKIFEATGEQKYYEIADFFWKTVTQGHIYVIGGTGEGEMFHGKNEIGALLTKFTAESCATYNMLKLTKELFRYQPKAVYMDYYEKAMLNHILSSCEHSHSGASTYFMPMAPGCSKEFVDENSCCHGTGMENHFKYGEAVYSYTEDSVYVNLLIPSVVTINHHNIKIKQEVNHKDACHVLLHIEAVKPLILKVRKPCWCDTGCQVRVNAEFVDASAGEDGYIDIPVGGTLEDVVKIEFPWRLHMEAAPDREEVKALLYGPYVLAALTDIKDYLMLPFDEAKLASMIRKEPDKLEFSYQEITFIPLCYVNHENYQVYFITG